MRHAAALHDIGKMGLPDSILRKPGRLTSEEIAEMREHATEGAHCSRARPPPSYSSPRRSRAPTTSAGTARAIPLGLEGEAIPLAGRIAAVCDVFDALVSVRPYKEAWPIARALTEIADQSGRHFDPEVAAALLTVVGRQERELDWVATVDDDREPGATHAAAAGPARVAALP